jgi:radical SAM protein with 4Fe4S-binding SPASM domain
MPPEEYIMKKAPFATTGKPLRGPGFWETIKTHLLGLRRPLDCIQVEVTSRCPGRCGYCPHTTQRQNWLSRDMNMETFERLWPLMRRAARVHLQGWGEPLLNPAFFDMAALARKAGCAASTTTCGLRMDPEIAAKIVESGMDIIAFSLAGSDAQSNASREGVDFERVCEAIATLQSARRERKRAHLEIHFAYLLLASAMEAVARLPALMQRLGVHAAVISTLDYIAAPGLEAEAFGPRETDKLARAAAILADTAAEARRLGLGFHYALPSQAVSGTACREEIKHSIFVSADGSLSPCVYVNVPADIRDDRRRVFGNVREQNPLEIWESADFRRFRERLAAGEADLPCRTCPKRFMEG